VQTSASLSPVPHHCSWKYDNQTSTVQGNIQRCFGDTVTQLDSFKAYVNKLNTNVYPILVPPCE